jgi:hypothetical protein
MSNDWEFAEMKAEVKALREKIELQEIALNDLCVSLNEERAAVAELRDALSKAQATPAKHPITKREQDYSDNNMGGCSQR